ncbi:sensor histidine kinase [Spirosoma radiotolerans]|uniref:histidine kinase n=1 Tax=Spirosoma radiotolerans TaxID=1379870 RepID=A0A0E3V990_9BACT|nr:HAMP domain-containing sensor histidine kinase [Spirosoma radiotolerans]AKD56931.1 histidine kinase [Spirosoma radiotolerans]
MTIRNRISGQFTLIVASILIGFSLLIYLVSATYRREEFYERLKSKARTTVRFLVEVKEVDRDLLRIIDRNTLTAMIDEKVLILDDNNKLVYSSVDDYPVRYKPDLLDAVRREREIETTNGENELVGILYEANGRRLVVLASAYDRFGQSKLQNLYITLVWGLLGGIGLTIGLGFFFAGQSLQPIGHINRQVQTITARNLRQRLDEGPRQDEIDQLAVNFNAVLQRLEQAFEQQRSFVSHASHELRTPLAALKSEIQLGLRRPLSAEHHTEILQNLLSDTDRLIALSNSLLLLARTLESLEAVTMTSVRLDDVFFTAQEELRTAHPSYTVQFKYDQVPETETDMVVLGNESLLIRVVLNLLDNACKYAADQQANVSIGKNAQQVWLSVTDTGIGLSTDEQKHIFEPFYRAPGAIRFNGFGIGLAVCQRITELHNGQISVESEPGKGSTFTIRLPRP